MRYDKFIREVRDRAGIEDRDEAERTAVVVLQALSDRLVGGETDDLLAQLPEPLKSSVTVTGEADRMAPEEFVQRVADELGLSPAEARTRIRAVFSAIRDAVTPGEFEDVLVELPKGYVELLPEPAVSRGPV
jgi:uncharacterized protein (DUF2267 family)